MRDLTSSSGNIRGCLRCKCRTQRSTDLMHRAQTCIIIIIIIMKHIYKAHFHRMPQMH